MQSRKADAIFASAYPGNQLLFLDQLKAKNPEAGRVNPSEFTDISFLKELENSVASRSTVLLAR
jgi:hypothetical protein